LASSVKLPGLPYTAIVLTITLTGYCACELPLLHMTA